MRFTLRRGVRYVLFFHTAAAVRLFLSLFFLSLARYPQHYSIQPGDPLLSNTHTTIFNLSKPTLNVPPVPAPASPFHTATMTSTPRPDEKHAESLLLPSTLSTAFLRLEFTHLVTPTAAVGDSNHPKLMQPAVAPASLRCR